MQHHEIKALQALILDMDGVLWREAEPLGDLPAMFRLIEQMGLKVVLATNNATRSVEQYQEKLRSFNVDLQTWQIINSAEAAAYYLSKRFPGGGPVYIVGEVGLVQTLERAGFYQSDQEVLAVVAAMDKHLTYEKLRIATLLIRAGAPFVGTNPDLTFPTPEGEIPGAGSILAAIQAATGVDPVIVGKPEPEMYQAALERQGTQPGTTLVVGDRLETDIAGGQALGCPTAVVLSGVSSLEDVQAWSPKPDMIAESLTVLLEKLKDERETIDI